MDRFVIEGGVSLRGKIAVRPAKNALLPCMAAALLTGEPVRLSDTARLQDIHSMAELLGHLGARVDGAPGGPMTLSASEVKAFEAPYDLVRKMRASILVLGPLLARFGEARVSLPGGCAIGTRPIDQHLIGLEALGAEISVEHGYVQARAKRLVGSEVTFDLVTVGGTENLVMAAALSDGETVLRNAAREPEVVDLCALLQSMGAGIEGVGTDTLRIHGVRELHGADHACIPDRIEAGTLAAAACITGGDVVLENAAAEQMDAFLAKLRSMGARADAVPGGIHIACADELRAQDATTTPYPGFPTDLQAQYLALLTQCGGVGTIRETIFENRFMHVPELCRMGADIEVQGAVAVVRGPAALTGAPVMASDLRASACLVLAGLCADGVTTVRRIYHLDRGYERLEERLNRLGARIRRISE
jgi:UDP-N-acetylglucosamine 1-carboxyvinyltransferase